MLCYTCNLDSGDMVDIPPPSGPTDLDALDDYLMSDRAPEDSVTVSLRPRHWRFSAAPDLDYCVQSQGSRASILLIG
jgi:hypothetical protein